MGCFQAVKTRLVSRFNEEELLDRLKQLDVELATVTEERDSYQNLLATNNDLARQLIHVDGELAVKNTVIIGYQNLLQSVVHLLPHRLSLTLRFSLGTTLGLCR